MIKACTRAKWKHSHRNHSKDDPIYKLDRKGQTSIFRLRTGHNKLKSHLHNTFKIGEDGNCRCGGGPETAFHILQECSLYDDIRKEVWGSHKGFKEMLCGTLAELKQTVRFLEMAGINP